MGELEKPELLLNLVGFVSVGMTILNARLLTLLALLFSAGFFAWVIYSPDPWRLLSAAAFAVLVFMPLQRMEATRSVRIAAPPPNSENAS